MNACVLMIKQHVNYNGVFYKTLLDVKGQMVICFLRSQLQRGEVLYLLSKIKTLSDIYSLDEKAVMIEL
jgi:hypothetical protein